MSLWNNKDYDSGNGKPLFANTSNLHSESTINDGVANTAKFYGSVFGVDTTEKANTKGHGNKVVHTGWVSQKIGTGPIKSVAWSGGTGINAAGHIVVTDGGIPGKGVANISYTIANSKNTLQAYSSNANWNVIGSITVVDGGSGWSASDKITGIVNKSNITHPTFTFTLGGRGDRTTYETLVAMGSITEDDPKDDTFFPQ